MIDELTFYFLAVLAIIVLGTACIPVAMSSRISEQEDEWPEIDLAHLHDTDNTR